MEASCFDVDAFAFVEINPRNPLKTKEILVPGAFLGSSDTSSTVVLTQQEQHRGSKKMSFLSTLTVNLGDFRLLDDNPSPERIFAHAVAGHHFDSRKASTGAVSTTCGELMEYRVGDQFFVMDSLHEKDIHQGKYDHAVRAVNLRNSEIGLVPASCLCFYPHAKVVEDFEWKAITDGRKLLNKVGDLVSIGHSARMMTWDPTGQKTRDDPFAFGRNRTTKFWGFIRIQNIVELSPEEIENWKRTNLLPVSSQNYHPRQHPPGSLLDISRMLKSPPLPNTTAPVQGPSEVPRLSIISFECAHSDPKSCGCQRKSNAATEFKRNNRIPNNSTPRVPEWRQRGDRYHVGAVGRYSGVHGGGFGVEGGIGDQGFNAGLGSTISGDGNGMTIEQPIIFYRY